MSLLVWRRLVLVAVVALVLTWVLSSVVDPTGSLVQLTWTVPAGLAALAGAMVVAGWPVRRWTRAPRGGAPTRPGGRGAVIPGQTRGVEPVGAVAARPGDLRRLDPLRATRVLALARASAFSGAATAGAYAAIALLTAPTAQVEPRLERLVLALLAVLAATALCVAGVVVERWCRVPPGSDDR